jgi:hypothetical protein
MRPGRSCLERTLRPSSRLILSAGKASSPRTSCSGLLGRSLMPALAHSGRSEPTERSYEGSSKVISRISHRGTTGNNADAYEAKAGGRD